MNRIVFFIAFCALLLCGLPSQCQDTSPYVYQDSAILYPEQEDTRVVDADDEEIKEDSYYVDTSLLNNQLKLSADSIAGIRNAKPFAYSKTLESLLKDAQKKQQHQTIETDDGPSFLDLFFGSRFTKIFFWV